MNARPPRVAVSPKLGGGGGGGGRKEHNDEGEQDDENDVNLRSPSRAGPSSQHKVGERRRELKDEAATTTTPRMKRKRSVDESSDLSERYVSFPLALFSSLSVLQMCVTSIS